MSAPPVPPDADLKDFPFTPIYRARLFGSAFHARANDAEWRAGVTLWLKSWDQHPAGSLPNDDTALCRLAELGRDLKTWRKLKTMALMHWEVADDNRLYHSTVTETVTEAWERKIAQRNRTKNARSQRLLQTLLQAPRDSRQRQGQETTSLSLRSRAPSSPLRFEEGLLRARGASQGSILLEKAREILGKSHGGLIRRMLRDHGPDLVSNALAAVETKHPDSPVAFFVACLDPNGHDPEPVVETHRGPQGPPPTEAEAEAYWQRHDQEHPRC